MRNPGIFVSSLTRSIDLMRLQKNPSQYQWDIQNLDKIRFYFAGLIDEKEELLERFFEEEYEPEFNLINAGQPFLPNSRLWAIPQARHSSKQDRENSSSIRIFSLSKTISGGDAMSAWSAFLSATSGIQKGACFLSSNCSQSSSRRYCPNATCHLSIWV